MSAYDFEAFKWYPDAIQHFPNIRQIDRIKSLACGLHSVLAMIEANDLRHPAGEAPLFSPFHAGNLQRLAVEVAFIIEEECEHALEWTEQHGMERMRELVLGGGK